MIRRNIHPLEQVEAVRIEMQPQLAHDHVAAPIFFRLRGDDDARTDHVDLVSRLPPYHSSSLSRERAARMPPVITANEFAKISGAEYIPSFRPEVTTGSRKSLKRPSFRSARLKKISSPMKSSSLNPPIASKLS